MAVEKQKPDLDAALADFQQGAYGLGDHATAPGPGPFRYPEEHQDAGRALPDTTASSSRRRGCAAPRRDSGRLIESCLERESDGGFDEWADAGLDRVTALREFASLDLFVDGYSWTA